MQTESTSHDWFNIRRNGMMRCIVQLTITAKQKDDLFEKVRLCKTKEQFDKVQQEINDHVFYEIHC